MGSNSQYEMTAGGRHEWQASHKVPANAPVESSERRDEMPAVDMTGLDVARLRDAVEHFEEAEASLPPDVQQKYRDALQSVIDARRHAETHEGLLRVC